MKRIPDMAIDSSIEKLRVDFHAKSCEIFFRGMSVIEIDLFWYLSKKIPQACA
jgi:hypothetical protein